MANREEVKAGSEKLEVCHAEAFTQEGACRFCWLRTVPRFALTSLKDVGKQEFPRKGHAATNAAATRLAATNRACFWAVTLAPWYCGELVLG